MGIELAEHLVEAVELGGLVRLDLERPPPGVQRLLPAAHLAQQLGQADPYRPDPFTVLLKGQEPPENGGEVFLSAQLLVEKAQAPQRGRMARISIQRRFEVRDGFFPTA